MNKSTITFIILIISHGRISNASIDDNADLDIDNVSIDVKYARNNSIVPIQSYSSDQNDFTTSKVPQPINFRFSPWFRIIIFLFFSKSMGPKKKKYRKKFDTFCFFGGVMKIFNDFYAYLIGY